jgi:alpha-tubulin suppressor-like RCC1 family protein
MNLSLLLGVSLFLVSIVFLTSDSRRTNAAIGSVSVTAGEAHTCALSDGSAYCWGNNVQGQLGQGDADLEPHGTPQPVKNFDGIVDLSSSGGASSCATTANLVACWGNNDFGQIGSGTVGGAIVTPAGVQGLTPPLDRISVGAHHTCALKGGRVLCWGSNRDGQLGDGRGGDGVLSSRPVEVEEVDRATVIAAGGDHTCALSSHGMPSCWGGNLFGQLGTSNTGECQHPLLTIPCSITAVPVDGLEERATRLASGNQFTCALIESRSVACWGNNDSGQLGRLTAETCAGAPCGRSPDLVQGLDGIMDLAVGNRHACAVDSDGAAWCWGDNTLGQLGDPDAASGPAPVRILLDFPASGLAVGGDHSCAVATSGVIACWGNNNFGQLGSDDTEARFVAAIRLPVRVEPIASPTSPLGVTPPNTGLGEGVRTGPVGIPIALALCAAAGFFTVMCGLRRRVIETRQDKEHRQ